MSATTTEEPRALKAGRWRQWEIDTAISMRRDGKTVRVIALMLGRSSDSVMNYLSSIPKAAAPQLLPANVVSHRETAAAENRSIAARKREAKAALPQRLCLKCRQMFPSWGPGNRLCDPCSISVQRYG